MTRADVDVVIVGARCAGAALGTFLARDGARVLLVERDPLHTDQVLSTHTIHPPGIDILDELGVGEAIRDVTPATQRARMAKNDAWAELAFEDGRAEYCPRRERLDSLLQGAAIGAGAEVVDRTRVTDVVFEDGRAVGVRMSREGDTREIRAELVVGADGRRSTVADEVGADEYLAYDAPRAMYWGYFDASPEWTSGRFPFGMYLGHRGEQYRVVFQTDDDQLLIGSLPPVAEARGWRGDPWAALRQNLNDDPVTGTLIDGLEPAEPIRGTLKERYFFRQGAGPGWVLVGDAGHHKEFVIGDGITEALLQARRLAAAIREGTEAALIRWWRARDVEALPAYFWGRDEGALRPPSLLETVVLRHVAEDPEAARLMTRLPEHQASPYDALPPSKVLPWIAGALFRGRFGVLPDFFAFGGRAREFGRELRKRRRLLEEAGAEPPTRPAARSPSARA